MDIFNLLEFQNKIRSAIPGVVNWGIHVPQGVLQKALGSTGRQAGRQGWSTAMQAPPTQLDAGGGELECGDCHCSESSHMPPPTPGHWVVQ